MSVRLTAKEFVEAYQKAGTLQELMDETGLKKGAITSRAANYRKAGVPLKLFGRQSKVNWEDLKTLAQDLLPEGAVTERKKPEANGHEEPAVAAPRKSRKKK